MRQAFREGRNTNVKGSSAAMRIYRARNAEYGLEIPASIQAMMVQNDQNDFPIDRHLDYLSFNGPVSHGANQPRSISSNLQWTSEQNTLSGEHESNSANAGRPASAHASLVRTGGSQHLSSGVSLAEHRPASTKPNVRPGTGKKTFLSCCCTVSGTALASLTPSSAETCSSCKAADNIRSRGSRVHGYSRIAKHWR